LNGLTDRQNVRMRFAEHPLFIPPDDPDAPIWRYIDFTRLVALLDTRSLFFARTDLLGDEFEGSYSRANVEMRPRIYPEIPAESLTEIARFTEGLRRHTYVNCWNLSEYESAALWGLYVPPEGGVALRSTFTRLTQCFIASPGDDEPGGNTSIYVGRVRYADYERHWLPEGNSMWPFVHKRLSFAFENEVRALIQDTPVVPAAGGGTRIDLSVSSPPGRLVEVHLDNLVERIHVSPVAPPWFSELVDSVCKRYEFNKPVTQSTLAERPVY
jgi:hypothetical protein